MKSKTHSPVITMNKTLIQTILIHNNRSVIFLLPYKI